jgi:hypothetical protein
LQILEAYKRTLKYPELEAKVGVGAALEVSLRTVLLVVVFPPLGLTTSIICTSFIRQTLLGKVILRCTKIGAHTVANIPTTVARRDGYDGFY